MFLTLLEDANEIMTPGHQPVLLREVRFRRPMWLQLSRQMCRNCGRIGESEKVCGNRVDLHPEGMLLIWVMPKGRRA